jgi:TPR repeat protein
MIARTLVAVALTAILAGSAAAGPLEDAYAALGRDDNALAAKLFAPLAASGNAEAQYNLGILYNMGWGVRRDDAKAVKLYRQAAEQGNAGAQHSLGLLYYLGLGVPRDYVLAYMWSNLAAAQGEPLAPGVREEAEKLMPPDQIAEAQRMAREWKPK